MKRSSNTPATFIAIPWTPAGRPTPNSARMMPQPGRQSMPRCHTTGSLPEINQYTATPLITRPATVVPTAAPAVPNRGNGQTRDERDIACDVQYGEQNAQPQ